MSDEVCKDYINLIKKKKIRFIYGYASSIYLLAKYALVHNEKISLSACFTTSELLQDHFRSTIKNAFLCEILDCYGANDGGINAFARSEGFFEVGYNCFVRIESPDQNEIGPALLTDLFNFAMPLINYKLGDEIQIDETKNIDYPYNGQIINKVFGRTSDIIILENGKTLTGPGFTILFKDLPVEHYCIKKSGINTIECSIVQLHGFTKYHEDIIRSTFNKQMGADTSFNIEYTTEIPRTKSGKRQYFKS
jgi:phenylacetate-CoA ligase